VVDFVEVSCTMWAGFVCIVGNASLVDESPVLRRCETQVLQLCFDLPYPPSSFAYIKHFGDVATKDYSNHLLLLPQQ
jgi:hypothetical protein